MIEQQVRAFFADYEALVNRALQPQPDIDLDAAVAVYADWLLEANPSGVICFHNDEAFRSAVPQLFESQRALGAQSMKIGTLKLTRLDDYHTMAKIHWDTVYRAADGREVHIDFSETYFVQTREGTTKIFAYIAGDQDQLLKDSGLVT